MTTCATSISGARFTYGLPLRPAISKARRALSMVSAMLHAAVRGGCRSPLTDSFASYLPRGSALYIGTMVEPLRRASLTSRHRRLNRLAASRRRIGGHLLPRGAHPGPGVEAELSRSPGNQRSVVPHLNGLNTGASSTTAANSCAHAATVRDAFEAGSTDHPDLRNGIGGFLPPSPRAAVPKYALCPPREYRMDHFFRIERGALKFQSYTVVDLQDTRNHTLLCFRSA